MVLVSPAVPPTRVLQGTFVLAVLLLLGPIISWKVFWMLWPARWTILATVAFAEGCFYWFYFQKAYKKHNQIPEPCQPNGFKDADGRRSWRRFIAFTKALPGGVDPGEYLQQWFCDAPFDQIRQENVREMLTYGFFYKHRDELSPDMQQYTHKMVNELEESLKMKFEPGYTPGLKFMSHLWEPLRAHYRPLLMYLCFEGLYFAQRLIMAGYGFQHRSMGHLGYYTLGCGLDRDTYSKHYSSTDISSSSRVTSKLDKFFDSMLEQLRPSTPMQRIESASSIEDEDYTPFADPMAVKEADGVAPQKNPLQDALPKGDTPVMFLHGVGGLMLYLEMLKHVIGLGHPVIVVEYKHVGMRLSSVIPDVDELTTNVVDIMDLEGIKKVCVVGHSYGSFLASRLNLKHRERIHSLCVIDPVALGMFMPHLLHNFMYRRPRIDLKRPDILARDLILWFASRDVHLSATFQRNFYWSEINMWPDDLPPGSCVILSGNDDLCNAEGVENMCKLAPQIKVIVNHDLFHGAFLLSTAHKANLMAEVRNLLATSGSLVVNMARPVLAHTISAAHSLIHGVETLKSRLSMSPTPFGTGQSPRGLEQRPSIWQAMSGLAGASLKKRGSVPTPTNHGCNNGSNCATPLPTRSPSAPAGELAAAAGSNGGSSSAGEYPAAAAGDGSNGSSPQGVAPAGASWWGAAAAAAAADCDQQPGTPGARGQQQQHKQLSVILSGPEGTLAGDLGQGPGGAGNRSGPQDGMLEDDWVMTDQNNGSGSGSEPMMSPRVQYCNVLGAIQEDGPQQQHQQQQGESANRSAAAAAAAAAAIKAVSPRGGCPDATAVEDQLP